MSVKTSAIGDVKQIVDMFGLDGTEVKAGISDGNTSKFIRGKIRYAGNDAVVIDTGEAKYAVFGNALQWIKWL